MEFVFMLATIAVPVILIIAGGVGFRLRLVKLMALKLDNLPDEYPGGTYTGAPWMGMLIIWSGEHREYRDVWLTGFAWTARIGMILFAVSAAWLWWPS
jgi:hypothetical protein